MNYQEVVLQREAWEREHRPFDVLGKLQHYEFKAVNGGMLFPLKDIPVAGEPGRELIPMPAMESRREFELQRHAMGQLLARLEYPQKFYDRMPDGLKYTTVNWLVQKDGYNNGVMLRCQDENKVRALMSSKFEPFDHLELLELLTPYAEGAIIRWHHDDDLVFHLSFTYPNTATEIKVGTVVEQGIHVSNSEVGLRSVTIASYVNVLRCSNGMIGREDGSFYRMRHTGDEDRLRKTVESAIKDCYMGAQGIVAKFKAALEKKIASPVDTIQSVCKEKNLTQEEFKKVLDCWGQEPGDSHFEVSQAFSLAAQSFDAEKRYDLQRIAVDVL